MLIICLSHNRMRFVAGGTVYGSTAYGDVLNAGDNVVFSGSFKGRNDRLPMEAARNGDTVLLSIKSHLGAWSPPAAGRLDQVAGGDGARVHLRFKASEPVERAGFEYPYDKTVGKCGRKLGMLSASGLVRVRGSPLTAFLTVRRAPEVEALLGTGHTGVQMDSRGKITYTLKSESLYTRMGFNEILEGGATVWYARSTTCSATVKKPENVAEAAIQEHAHRARRPVWVRFCGAAVRNAVDGWYRHTGQTRVNVSRPDVVSYKLARC